MAGRSLFERTVDSLNTKLHHPQSGGRPSTAIKDMRYDPDDDTVDVKYKGGDHFYTYDAGGIDNVRDLVKSESKGRKMNEWKKDPQHNRNL